MQKITRLHLQIVSIVAISIAIGIHNKAQGQTFSEVGIMELICNDHVFHMDSCMCCFGRFAYVKEITGGNMHYQCNVATDKYFYISLYIDNGCMHQLQY